MAMSVWKFPLTLDELQDVEMPANSKIIKVDQQRERNFLWAWCNPHPDTPKEKRRIVIVGTGHAAPDFGNAEHIGTVLNGDLVWHVFERRRPLS